ncbi:Rv2578c family radical SAM protein [Myceligenerans sp. TRM 65318]|uniref:Rv2578c family radical SAM protein n=1 Tax=Myceligenerans pegani TaxID=2776917 RepID=A0ABR9MZB9_9MICO|nr:Rv2578c family radical SAM protein [Myceligenerans sp. TRM 65318]MBE1876753.1 Rv2578c family radical SAM protein [Myceligenerans sp. TRM 65318]MBE3019024.1 Rv2578c family radical SAM protein [Myceligenerans sp. TRM 65318]
MRWAGQQLTTDDGALPGLELPALRTAGLIRAVRSPEFDGVTFHEVVARSALSKVPAASRMPFRWTVNPYRGCSHACRYCLAPDTPVLLGDGTWRPIGDLVPGDRVIGTLPDGGRRVLVETDVRDAWRTVKRAYRVTTADGTTLVASGDHRFLTGDGWRYVAGASADEADARLAPSAGRVPHGHPSADSVDPGTARAERPVLRPGDGLAGIDPVGGPGLPGSGAPSPVDVVGRLVRTSPGRTVVSVEDLGHETDLVDITTGTGDFVADGVISHNCYARGSHTYLDLDAGADFDSQVVVKVNVDEVLRAELARPSWGHESVALGTNTDPYQRAEGRYRLMPGIISALADSGTPFSILTKGTLLRRDLPLLTEAAERVEVGLGVSLAFADEELQQRVEPGTPTPRARLALIRAIREAGLPCGVMVAPVLPWLTDSRDHLARLLDAVSEAGATGATVLPLHLRPGAREWYLEWLRREFPQHAAGYRRIFGDRAYVDRRYQDWLWERAEPLLAERGLGRAASRFDSGPDKAVDDDGGTRGGSGSSGPGGPGPGSSGSGGPGPARGDEGAYPEGAMPASAEPSRGAPAAPDAPGQDALF